VKLKTFYDLVISNGILADPRPKAKIQNVLKKTKKRYDSLKPDEKQDFDLEQLKNPYSDSRVLCGDLNVEVKNLLLGIDIDVGEILLAERLKQKGEKIDLIVAHHPEGRALAALHQVMDMQTDIAYLRGVPITVAEGLMQKRIGEIERRLLPVNHTKTADAARLLGIPFICVHTPADNHVHTFLQKIFDKKKPEVVGEIFKVLKDIPEYKAATKNNAGPKIVNGAPESRAGKVFVDMTGGTEGSKEIFQKLATAGVGTIVCMHLSEGHLKKAREAHINVIIAGHISSDNIGLNLILDAIEKQKKQKFKIIECSGFVRVRRK